MQPLTRLLAPLLFAFALHATAATPEPAPDLTLEGSAGTVRLSELRGQVVYLDFWASWCGPCRQSFPWMDELQARYGARGLKVVAVNLDKERALAEKFLAETRPTFLIAFDPQGQSAESYQVVGMPSSYLIDRDGNIVARHIGFRAREKGKLEAQIEGVLNK